MPDHVAIGLNGDPLRNQILFDHVHQILALDILGGGPRRNSFRIQVGLSAELIDPLGEKVEMLLLLRRVLCELRLHRLAREAGRTNSVEFVTEYANDLGRYSMV